jgi:hypothetical protein
MPRLEPNVLITPNVRQQILVEAVVKFFRSLALMLAIGVFPAFLVQAGAQQEVDPDHFEQAPTAQANLHGSKVQGAKAVSTSNRWHGNLRVASKHSAKANHHRSHVSA